MSADCALHARACPAERARCDRSTAMAMELPCSTSKQRARHLLNKMPDISCAELLNSTNTIRYVKLCLAARCQNASPHCKMRHKCGRRKAPDNTDIHAASLRNIQHGPGCIVSLTQHDNEPSSHQQPAPGYVPSEGGVEQECCLYPCHEAGKGQYEQHCKHGMAHQIIQRSAELQSPSLWCQKVAESLPLQLSQMLSHTSRWCAVSGRNKCGRRIQYQHQTLHNTLAFTVRRYDTEE